MNTDTGEFRELTLEEQQSIMDWTIGHARYGHGQDISQSKYVFKTDKPREVIVTEEQRKLLEQFQPHERPRLHHDLMSRNNNAKRRARRKIANMSRRRNRR